MSDDDLLTQEVDSLRMRLAVLEVAIHKLADVLMSMRQAALTEVDAIERYRCIEPRTKVCRDQAKGH